MRLHPFFSYYGAKWRLAPRYPSPQYKLVIEPFAGSACYSLYHHQHDVVLIDLDPVIAGIWQWLISANPADVMALPDKVDDIREVDAPDACRDLIGFWLVKGSACPVNRPYAWARTGDWDDQFWGPEIKRRIANQLKYVRHWQVCCTDYRNASAAGRATWFVDPPYQRAGKHYIVNNIDHADLASWCLQLDGQVIVCEQRGAGWLPFEPFKKTKALKSRQSEEVIYLRGPQGRLF